MAEKTFTGLAATGTLTAIVGGVFLFVVSAYMDVILLNIRQISYLSILLLLFIGLILIAWIRSLTFVTPTDKIEVLDKTVSKDH